MRAIKPILLVFTAALALSACNTIAGAGRDIRSAGDTIEDAAD
jgi:predicted small secreted protein